VANGPNIFSNASCYSLLTSGDVDEVSAAGSVDLDVALSEVVLVTTQSQYSLFAAVKPHQRLAVASTLLAEA